MAAKILLVNPNLMKPVVSPVALDYLGIALKNAGFEVELLDLAFSSDVEHDIKRTLSRDTFVLIGVTVRNLDDSYYASQDFILEKTKGIIDLIKKYSDTPLVLGGVGFSIMPELALAYCEVDLGIVGEGELALPMLADRLVKKEDYTDIPNLVYRTEKGYKRNKINFYPLEKNSFAKRDTIDNLRYYQEGGMVGFETKRGCNQPCSYCADPVSKGKKVRCRPPQDIVDELAHLFSKGVDYFHTCDSEFNVDYDHAVAVCDELIDSGLGNRIRWYAYCNIVPFDEKLAAMMRKAGCVGIDFVADHVEPKMLKVLGNQYTFDDIEKVAKLCHKYGMAFMFDLLLGAPGETRETIQETIEKLKTLNPTRVGVSLGLRIYPQTPMYTRFKELFGKTEKELLPPTFYLEPALGEDIEEYIEKLTAGDSRFMFGNRKKIDRNYNYNDNNQLVQAIVKQGYKGAFWDILRKAGESPKS
ncbi:MAG: radical SAM protein [bacterium]|nr:radical SAM protein [bacterium]